MSHSKQGARSALVGASALNESRRESCKMSGNDSAISVRESREEQFEEFAPNKNGLTSRREPIISPRLAVLLQPVFPAGRSRAV